MINRHKKKEIFFNICINADRWIRMKKQKQNHLSILFFSFLFFLFFFFITVSSLSKGIHDGENEIGNHKNNEVIPELSN